MAIFYTDSGSLRDLKVSGSTLMAASTGLAVQVKSSGSTIFSVSGSGGEIFSVSDIGSSNALFTISSGSTTIVNVDNTKKVIISGSLQVTGSTYIKGLTTTAQASFVSIDTASGQLYTAGTSSFTASQAVSSSYAFSSSYALSSSYAVSSSYALSASFAATASNILGGANNYIPLWTGSTQLSSSVMYQSGSNIGIGTGVILPNYKLHVSGTGISGSFNANDILTVSGSQVKVSGSHTITGSLAVSGAVNIKGLAGSSEIQVLAINTGSGNVTARSISLNPFADYFGSYYSLTTQAGSTSPQTIQFGIGRNDTVTSAEYAQQAVTMSGGNVFRVDNEGWYDITAVLNINDSSFGTNNQNVIVYPQYSFDNTNWFSYSSYSIRSTFTGINNAVTTTYRLFLQPLGYYRLRWIDGTVNTSTLSLKSITAQGEISATPATMLNIRFISPGTYLP
jgi:hypothetical protein